MEKINRKHPSPLRLMVLIVGAIFGSEVLVMSLLHDMPFNSIWEKLLYAIPTGITAFVLLLFFLYLPMAKQIKELIKVKDELRNAKDRAEKANKLKEEFLNTMSHETLTPLNGIIGMTELILNSERDEEKKEYLYIILESSHWLLSLLMDIFDFNKLEAKKVHFEKKRFDLKGIIVYISHIFSQKAKDKGLGFSYHTSSDIPDHLIGDSGRLLQAIINILDNAIKFTEKGQIIFEIGQAEQRFMPENKGDSEIVLHFSISDTGIGIEADKFDKIFESFRQMDSSYNRRYSGMGIGLSISKKLIELMGGKIWLESEVSIGTTFHFIIPFALVSSKSTSI